MPTPEQLSTSNVQESVASYLAAKLCTAGYLVYRRDADLLQLDAAGTVWFRFAATRATALANATVAAALTAAKGVVSLYEAFPAEPAFVARLISETALGTPDEVQIPAWALDLGGIGPTQPYEVGSLAKWWPRHLTVDCYARDKAEQKRFADYLAVWLLEDQAVAVQDHDAGTLASLGTVDFQRTRVDSATWPDRNRATAYQTLANTLVEYVA